MKFSRSILAYVGLAGCLCLVGFVMPVGGQAPAAGQGIVGMLDPQTGTFKPLIKPTVIEDLETAPNVTTPTTGTFKVNFTIAVKSAIPSGDGITCEVTANAVDVASGHTVLETAAVAAARTGTAGATCSVTIPYSWVLTSPASDMVTLQYAITTAVEGTSLLPHRQSIHTISTGKVPASGATTTIYLTPTI